MLRYVDRLCIYDQDNKLIADHLRCYERYRDFENPQHVQQLLKQRKQARERQSIGQFLKLTPAAELYYHGLKNHRFDTLKHIRKILSLLPIYGSESIVGAIREALTLEAFGADYIAMIIEQRARVLPEPGHLHLTRKEDLLHLQLPLPNLDLYHCKQKEDIHHEKKNNQDHPQLERNLQNLRLIKIAAHYHQWTADAARDQLTHFQFLEKIITFETEAKKDRALKRRITSAKFPVIKTLEQFNWNHPKKINRALVEHLFTLDFISKNTNVIFVGPCGMGKTHLATALAYHACCQSANVLFRSAMEIINSLAGARKTGRFQFVMKKYTACDILLIDELGYLPVDKFGADLLFQVISGRYERGPILLTLNYYQLKAGRFLLRLKVGHFG